MVGRFQSKNNKIKWAINLNDTNFDEYIGQKNCVIVEFYTKWCRYCKILAPEYEKLVLEYKTKRPDIIIARIEGQENTFSLQRFNIYQFPMIALFKPLNKNIFSFYRNQRTFEEMKKWIDELCVEAPQEDKNNEKKEEQEKEIKKDDVEANLTSVNEYIQNEFVNINKKIENLKNQINSMKKKEIKKEKNYKIRFELELSPVNILLIFMSILLFIGIYTTIKKLFFVNKEHIK